MLISFKPKPPDRLTSTLLKLFWINRSSFILRKIMTIKHFIQNVFLCILYLYAFIKIIRNCMDPD